MKNFKSVVYFTICFLASFVLMLVSPFTLNVNAEIDSQGSNLKLKTAQTEYLTISNTRTSLYNESGKLYRVSLTNNNKLNLGDYTMGCEYNNGDKSVKLTTNANSLDRKNPRYETAFKLDSKYIRAINAQRLKLNLKVKIENDENANFQIAFQEGTLNGSNGVFESWTAKDENYFILETKSHSESGKVFDISFIPTSTDYLLVFANVKKDSSISNNEIKITDPIIELSPIVDDITNNDNAINISNILVNGKASDSSWTANNKKVTFTVKDGEIGIDRVEVTVNGNNVVCTDETPNSDTEKTFSFEADSVEEKSYKIVAYDHLGRSRQAVTTKVGKVDKTDVSDITINAEKSYHNKNISIPFSFVEDTTSLEKVYYTLIDNSTGEDSTPNPDDTTGKTKEVLHQSGKYTFNFNFDYDGEYLLTLLIVDEAGHSKTFTKTFTIDSVKRRVNVENHNGEYTLSGVFEDEEGFYTWNGETITLNYTANENFSFYKLLRNGSEMQTNGSVYNYVCRDADINIEIFNRFNVVVNPQTSYEFCEDGTNLIYTLNTNNFLTAVTKGEIENIIGESVEALTDEEILGKLEEFILNNLTFTIKFNGFNTESIYVRGIYTVTYNIDTQNFVGTNSFDINVIPKALQVEYLENNFVYNGEKQHINYNKIPNQTIIEKYYLITNGVASSEETSFINAGDYKVVLSTTDENYAISNAEIFVTINKKQISAELKVTTFKYNANSQNIVYSLSEDIETNTKYYKQNEDGHLQETSFVNAGSYNFAILPQDEVNYEILNGTGSCEILKVVANVKVTKNVYDYTGNTLTLEYIITDEDNNNVEVNNLVITYYVNGEETEFCAPNQYTFNFDTIDRDNYVLGGELTGSATIKKTIINIYVNTTTYEYTGSEINLDYYFINEEDEKLTNLNNISLVFTKNAEEVAFLECGEYSYEFVTTDVNYDLIYNNKTNVNIIPAILNVEVLQDSYIYSEQGNTLNYKVTSNFNIDFTNNSNITLIITNNGEEASLINVGIYEYNFVSNNQNIILSSGNIGGVITIVPKAVTVQNLVTEYVYNGLSQTLSFSLSEDILCNIEIDELLNVGTYNYVISSKNSNYVISNGVGSVKVTPQQIEISSIETSYEYTGKNINVTFALAQDVETVVTYKVNGSEEILNSIVNANSYKIFITPTNSNCFVDTDDILINVNPKKVTLNVTNLNQTYNKQNRQISVDVEDGVSYSVTYFYEGNEVTETINAGSYNFVVNVTNPNYIGSETGTLVVSPLDITLNVSSDLYKVYGEADLETYPYTLQGVISGDEVNVELLREKGEDVGFYKINLDSYTNSNYNINYNPVNFKIIAKKLIIVASNVTKTYEDETETLPYTITYGGEVKLNGSLSRQEGEDVGVYQIEIGTLQTLNPNYQIIFKKANLTIVPRDLKIKINNVETTYGENKTLSYSVDGQFNESMLTGDIAREEGNDAGEYVISKGTLQSKNYNLIITNGIYKINPKNASVTPINIFKTYGEEDNLSFVVTGIINDDIIKGSLGREEGNNAGTYLITLGTLETLNPNYKFNLPQTYYTINRAVITISIDNQTQVYGEAEKELTYSVVGLKLNDEVVIKPFRESGSDVGSYQISCGIPQLDNYYVLLTSGTYTITKAKASPVLTSQTTTYNGLEQVFTNTTFPYELQYTYKRNGIQVTSVKDAGTYVVQGYFAGNNNYEEARSNAVTFTINKVAVCFNLGNNNFIYDGEAKSPVFTFDETIGLSSNAVTFEFENNVIPKEVGSYNFTILVNDANFTGSASGVLTISKPVTIVSNDAIIECGDANIGNVSALKLVNRVFNGKFNNQEVLQACAFENFSGISGNHVFTVRMKAKTGENNVYVYKVDKNNVASEVVVSVQDGYYVFKVDGLDCQYIITKDIEPMSLITIAVIIVVSIIILISIVIAFKIKRNRKKKKLALQTTSGENVQVESEALNEVTKSKKHKNKKVRVDDIVSSALNNGTINTDVESILDAKPNAKNNLSDNSTDNITK